MSKSGPFDLDDDDRPARRPRRDDGDRPRRRRRDDEVETDPSLPAKIGMIVLMVLSGIAVLLALESPAVQGAVWAGVACCAGIHARICQAERHHLAKKG